MADTITHATFRSWKERLQPFRSPSTACRYFASLVPVLALTGAVFLPLFAWLWGRFGEENSYYSHGYLMPLLAAWLLWQRRGAVRAHAVESDPAGLLLVAAGLLSHAAGAAFSIRFVSGVSFIIVLFGLSLYFLGRRITRVLALPLLFLASMIPLPQVLLIAAAFRMKMLAAQAASALVAGLGLPLTHRGSSILLPGGTLTVGDQCSGMNSLIALLTLGAVFACTGSRNPFRRLALVGGALPIALCANIARISFLIFASFLYGPAAVTGGPLHFGAGIILWLSAVGMLLVLERILPWK